jgi:hypothetical protein
MSIIKRIKELIGKVHSIERLHADVALLRKELENERLLLGRLGANAVKELPRLEHLHDAEFKVFSQWGDDGIVQYLVHALDIPVKKFVEFGVSDYREATTRFLLLNDNWSGLVLDCSEANVASIRNDDIYWKHDLTALPAFVTAENINEILSQTPFTGEIGLLHIDVDGNDYWIWKAIDAVAPVIAVLEYNSLFGPERTITIPYHPAFDRFAAHHSGIYAGASLASLCDLAQEKGYVFVGSNSAGNNAYFVRKDKAAPLRALTAAQGYVASRFREHRDERGFLTFLPGAEAMQRLRGMPVFNTKTNRVEEL